MWLGATRFGDEWVNFGKAGEREKLTFKQWGPGEPNGLTKNTHEECLGLSSVNQYFNQWNDNLCNDDKYIKGYICERLKFPLC